MKDLFLTILGTFSIGLTIFFALITFNDLHQSQFNLTYEQSKLSLIFSIMFLIVSIIEIINNK